MNPAESKNSGRSVYPGTWLSIGSPVIAELAAECGFHWVLIDLEHGCEGESALPNQLRALRGSRTKGVVRVTPNSLDTMGRALDWGAEGIMVPHVNSAEQAETLLKAMRYPPAGSRGVSRTVRSYAYGLKEFDRGSRPLFFAQIETLEGVRNAREIAEVPGVDVLFVGPADLQHDLLCAEDNTAPSYDECLQLVVQAAGESGKQSGILLRDPAQLSALSQMGFQWLAVQSDLGILRQAFQHMLQNFENTI